MKENFSFAVWLSRVSIIFFICVFYIKRICILCIPDHVCLPPLSTLHGSVKRSLFFQSAVTKQNLETKS